MLTIHKTQNYKQFKNYACNRPIIPERLVASIKKKNLLENHPILIGKDKYIIDGQHRLAAAEILQVPIYYIEDENLDETSISICQIQKTWELADYLNYYKRYDETYVIVDQICKQFDYTPSFVIRCSSKDPYCLKKFREGEFKIDKDKKELQLLFRYFKDASEMIKKISSKPLRRNVQIAIWNIINTKNYDHDHFLEKIDKYPQQILQALKLTDISFIYEELIVKVYNINNKDKKKT